MKAPYYETAPGATAALLLSGSFVDVDLYSFTLAGNFFGASELRISAGPIDVAAGGTYWPQGQTFDQGRAKAVAHWKVGLDVDQWQVVVAPRLADPLTGAANPDRIGSAPFLVACQAGALDGAGCQVDRAFAPTWSQTVNGQRGPALAPTGIVTLFYGRVGEIDVGRSQAVITLYSALKVLANPVPRNLFQSPCVHTLFDAGCSLAASAFAQSGTVAGLGSAANVFTSAIGAPGGSGTYALGRVTMTSGASAGFSRTVRSWMSGSPSTFALLSPFPLGIAPGDAFTAYPGCDKRYGTCGAFGNQVNFGGCNSIPVPETAL